METGNQSNKTKTSTDVSVIWSVKEALTGKGRRNISLLGFPQEAFFGSAAVFMYVGMPILLVLAMLPFWENVAEISWVKFLDYYLSPGNYALPSHYQARGTVFPFKGFVVGTATMTIALFLCNFLLLISRKGRRNALMVWQCYNRTKLIEYLLTSTGVFFGLWYILYFDWRVLALFTVGGKGGKVQAWFFMAMPAATFIFGRLTAIVTAGFLRTIILWYRK